MRIRNDEFKKPVEQMAGSSKTVFLSLPSSGNGELMDLRFVTLAEIDLDDGTFEIRRFTVSTRLRESLGRFGILDPAWVGERSGKYIIVDGFQRLGWARENGESGALCRIFPEDYDARELWTRRIEKKIFEREINLAEKVQIMSVIIGLFQPEQIPGFFFAGLNVARRSEVLRKWALLSAAESEILEIFATGAICERAALEVAGWDARSRDSALRVLEALRCSASIQVEIVERINEIAIREEKAGADIIEDSRVREILGSKGLNHRQKTRALRDVLGELRHPRLSARQKRFQSEIEALGLPPEARIIPPAYFEGSDWTMELSFTGPDELRKIFESAGCSVKSDRFNALFKAHERQR